MTTPEVSKEIMKRCAKYLERSHGVPVFSEKDSMRHVIGEMLLGCLKENYGKIGDVSLVYKIINLVDDFLINASNENYHELKIQNYAMMEHYIKLRWEIYCWSQPWWRRMFMRFERVGLRND